MILAIDPGTTESGYVYLHEGSVVESGTVPNERMLARIAVRPMAATMCWAVDTLAIEMVASYGMPVGKEVFETVRWIGRFQQAWHNPEAVRFVYRQDVKLRLCKSVRAKDSNIRQALLDLLGPQGTKAKPGPLYGVKGDAWAALGVAVTAQYQLDKRAVLELAEAL